VEKPLDEPSKESQPAMTAEIVMPSPESLNQLPAQRVESAEIPAELALPKPAVEQQQPQQDAVEEQKPSESEEEKQAPKPQP